MDVLFYWSIKFWKYKKWNICVTVRRDNKLHFIEVSRVKASTKRLNWLNDFFKSLNFLESFTFCHCTVIAALNSLSIVQEQPRCQRSPSERIWHHTSHHSCLKTRNPNSLNSRWPFGLMKASNFSGTAHSFIVKLNPLRNIWKKNFSRVCRWFVFVHPTQ